MLRSIKGHLYIPLSQLLKENYEILDKGVLHLYIYHIYLINSMLRQVRTKASCLLNVNYLNECRQYI